MIESLDRIGVTDLSYHLVSLLALFFLHILLYLTIIEGRKFSRYWVLSIAYLLVKLNTYNVF